MFEFETVSWKDGGGAGDAVVLIDQRVLPAREVYLELHSAEEVADAIRTMVVRGAPAIGVTAAMGAALGARLAAALPGEAFARRFAEVCELLAATRPTAVNLFWAIERMRTLFAARRAAGDSNAAMADTLVREALLIKEEDIAACRRMGRFGAELVPDTATILTHCNAGALATAGYGTALGVIRGAVEAGKRVRVLADETRPFLQGARLTAWELARDGIDTTLITDSMAGHHMKQGLVDLVIVGADRIAANGDVANKIGTYSVAVLAKENKVPFYVAAPISTVDLATPDGDAIPIEQRDPAEVTHMAGTRIAPEGIGVANPAFDVTPNRYVTAIITERGIARAPYTDSLRALVRGV